MPPNTDLLARLSQTVIRVADGLEDEGDRVYLGTTNHADELRDLADECFELEYLDLAQSFDRPKGE